MIKKISLTKNKLFYVLLVLFFIHLFFRFFSYRDEYVSRYDPKYWEGRYLRSQWVIPNSKEPVGDDGLFAYEGWEYVQGRDPSQLNAEVPPLGKYLIGLSIIIFGNQNIFALLSGVLVLCAFYYFNIAIFKDKLLAFVPVFLFSLEPLFYTQFRAPFLDSLYLGFFLLILLFVIKKKYLISAICLGLMAATKSSLTTFIVVGGTIYMYFLFSDLYVQKMKTIKFSELRKYILYLPLSVFVFLLTYSVYFLKGNNLMQFLGVQKWIINFYSGGAKGEILTPWRLLLTGQWQTWFSGMQSVGEWHVGWAILLLLSIFTIVALIKNRQKDPIILIGIWVTGYLIFLSIIPMWPRYLLLLLPFMYNLSVWRLTKSILPSSLEQG